ncbi:hypothetical protein [Paraburkholderia monticola]|uniref:hypothetical protein n=1 Tax=Paraburkholderia monticola TaxID=1399968 RepID=UPI0030C761F7
MLARSDEITIRGLVQTRAMGLLRHYPLDIDLDVSASALPGIWAVPIHRGPGSIAAIRRQTRIPRRCDEDEIRNKGADDDETPCSS